MSIPPSPTLVTSDSMHSNRQDEDDLRKLPNEKDIETLEMSDTQKTTDESTQPVLATQKDDYRSMNPVLWLVFVASIVSSPFLFSFDMTVVGNLQPQILRDLGEVEKLPWISVAYALGALSTTLLWGRLYTVWNIKWVFMTSFLIFEAGSAVSGAAPTMNVMIGGRMLSGLGAVGIYSGALHTLAVVTTIKQRPLYISFITLAVGSGAILAPIIAGSFADSAATWRWGFYINICIGGLFTPGYLFLFPPKTYLPASVTISQRLQRLEVLGNLLWAGACTAVITAISFGGSMYAWSSGQIIGLFVASGALWALFALQQRFKIATSEESRIFPVHFLRSLEMCILFAQIGVSSAIAQTPVFLIPIYFQFVRASSALSAGLHLLPLLGCRSVFVLVNGFLMRKYGRAMPWYLAGSILCLAGSVPFLVVDTSTSTANIYGYTVLIGCGVGLYNQASFAVAQARVTPKLVPQAVSFITTGQIIGIALALAVANSIFINRAARLVSGALPDVNAKTLEGALLGVESNAWKTAISTNSQEEVLQAIVHALNDSWASIVAACVVSVVLSVFMKRDKVWK